MAVALAPAIGERDVASTATVPRFQGPPREAQPAPQCDEQREAGTFYEAMGVDELRELGQQECEKLRPDARQRILEQGQAYGQLMLERHGHFLSGRKKEAAAFDRKGS